MTKIKTKTFIILIMLIIIMGICSLPIIANADSANSDVNVYGTITVLNSGEIDSSVWSNDANFKLGYRADSFLENLKVNIEANIYIAKNISEGQIELKKLSEVGGQYIESIVEKIDFSFDNIVIYENGGEWEINDSYNQFENLLNILIDNFDVKINLVGFSKGGLIN
ncbi:MAG: hypothetical protein K2G70_04480 [Turicibacter sp.]|nr:hypothetical protein [Turicibacter sp.]